MERQLARRDLELASVAGAVGHQDALSTPDTAGPHRPRPAPGEASARSVQDLKSEMRDQRNALDLTLKEHEASSQKLLSAGASQPRQRPPKLYQLYCTNVAVVPLLTCFDPDLRSGIPWHLVRSGVAMPGGLVGRASACYAFGSRHGK